VEFGEAVLISISNRSRSWFGQIKMERLFALMISIRLTLWRYINFLIATLIMWAIGFFVLFYDCAFGQLTNWKLWTFLNFIFLFVNLKSTENLVGNENVGLAFFVD